MTTEAHSVDSADSDTAQDDAPTLRMEDLVSLCARRGFIFQSGEIYGGLNGFWD